MREQQLTDSSGEGFDLEAAILYEEARDPETGLSHATLRADVYEELYQTEIGWVLHRSDHGDRTGLAAESWEKVEPQAAAAWLARNNHALPPDLKGQ